MTTQAIYLNPPGGLDHLVIEESKTVAPEFGEISVRIYASSLNYHDYGVVTTQRSPTQGRIIPLSDGAGVVTAIGEDVTEFAIGDHVMSTFFPDWVDGLPQSTGFATTPGDGIDGFAQQNITAPIKAFTHAPMGYSHAEAATLSCAGLTAWRALFGEGQLKAGDTVLLIGTGGVSIFALQFAKAAGATVIAISSSEKKLEQLVALGADHVINYQKSPNWGEKAVTLTRGRGVDHVIEIGGAQTLAQSMIAARVGGHIAMIGFISGHINTTAITPIVIKQLQLKGLLVGNRRHQIEMTKAIEANAIKPIIDCHFPLEALADAFRYQETQQHFGKICLTI